MRTLSETAHLNLAQGKRRSNILSTNRYPRRERNSLRRKEQSRASSDDQRTRQSAIRKSVFALTPTQVWKILFQIFQFWQVVVDDVWIIRIIFQIVLVVALGFIKCLERLNLCDDLPRVNFRGVQLRYVSLSDTLLIFVREEDRGAVLGAGVRALAIPLRGIMRDREKNHQELAVGDLGRIINDADGFRVAGNAHTHAFVRRGLNVAARVARGHGRNSLQMLENGLHAPKAASGKNRGLVALGRGQGNID